MSNQTEAYLHTYHESQDYLRLSRVYAEYLGGLRWSATEDSLIHVDGRLFAFHEAIAEFVDGFASQGRVIAFGYLLHWMDLLLNQRQLSVPVIQRLFAIFLEAGGGNWRNAGALAALLSGEVPEVPQPPDLEMVAKRLRNRAFPIRWFLSQFRETTHPPAQPVLAPDVFEQMVIAKLVEYSEEDLRAWLQTGRGPIRHAEQLAEELPLPRSLARALAALLERPRLAGAVTYVAQLVGALALPPRRFVPQELPVGGYTDIVTRGQVEQLLPTQFALDELEFLRRFSENELLYFRREEPPAQNRQELVVLLDQGVRTWGDVRLVLGAAALAYGKQALKRKTPFWLAATSNHGHVIDPAEENADSLGRLVEASDLSLNPGLALEQVLETTSEAQRDVVLLTHPRSLREADVLNAARRLGPRDRLFAVALDGHGQVEVSEVRRGTPIKLRQFHVAFVPSKPKPRRHVPSTAVPGTPWTGEVEPIPFPFRLGTEPHVTHFDFDYDGQWLLTVSGQGTLHIWKLDGSAQEMLPRPLRGQALKVVIGVIGVAGGFVVAARRDNSLMFAHYDITRRHCKLHEFNPYVYDKVQLYYEAATHSVVMMDLYRRPNFTIDLRMEKPHFVPVLDASASQPEDAPVPTKRPSYNRELPWSNHVKAVGKPFPIEPLDQVFCEYDGINGRLIVHDRGDDAANTPVTLVPQMDGKACLIHSALLNAQYAGDVLSLRVNRKDIGESITLVQCSEAAILREYPISRKKHKITRHLLSFDGSRIALMRSDHRVEVDAVQDRGLPTVCTRVGGYTMESYFYVGEKCVFLNLGSGRQFWHRFGWASGTLEHQFERKALRANDPAEFMRSAETTSGAAGREDGWFLGGGADHYPPLCKYDEQRFVTAVAEQGLELYFLLDRFGQLTVLDRKSTVLAMFVAFRDRWAAWMPDGTRLGNLTLSLGPPTPGAAEKIGQALLRAEKGDGP